METFSVMPMIWLEKLADLYQNPMKVKSMADNAFGDRVQFSRDSVMNTYLESISKA